jgi:hypothetical protein
VIEPLITNKQLRALLARANGMSKANQDTMWEALVFVRGIYERERIALTAIPIDDIEWIISRYFFQIERGQDARLDRINEWLDQAKPLEQTP